MRVYFILSIFVIFINCNGQSKINGVSFVASPSAIDQTHIVPVKAVNANWAAVMPFGFLRSLETPKVVFNIPRQWWGERRDGAKKTIELLQEANIKVMLKPQIWVWKGEFTGNITMNSDKNWELLEQSYQEFILLYARLAEELKVPLFCIGTELHTFVQQRPQFWLDLIQKIRSVYQGKLTYAENWDQFENVPFWEALDYIGIDAYFPLSEAKNPTLEKFKSGWKKHKTKIEQLQFKKGKWYHNHDDVGGVANNRFTIQNKPAEEVIKSLYRNE